MTARIFQPARTAMQSGTAKTHHWVLEFVPDSAREVDPPDLVVDDARGGRTALGARLGRLLGPPLCRLRAQPLAPLRRGPPRRRGARPGGRRAGCA